MLVILPAFNPGVSPGAHDMRATDLFFFLESFLTLICLLPFEQLVAPNVTLEFKDLCLERTWPMTIIAGYLTAFH